MAVEKRTIEVTTTGSAGSAAGTGAVAVPAGAEVLALHIDYHASAPATTDVTLSAVGEPDSQTIETITSSVTDGWHYPRQQVRDSAGALVAGAYDRFIAHAGILTVAVAQCDALTDAVVATIYLRS